MAGHRFKTQTPSEPAQGWKYRYTLPSSPLGSRVKLQAEQRRILGAGIEPGIESQLTGMNPPPSPLVFRSLRKAIQPVAASIDTHVYV